MSYRKEKDEKMLSVARQLNGTTEPWCEEYEKMISGMMYDPNHTNLLRARHRCRGKTFKFNNADPGLQSYEEFAETKAKIVSGLFGSVGEGTAIEAPLNVDYGCNTIIGKNTFINFNATILDTCLVTIGDRVLFGPNVSIYSATHLTSVLSRIKYVEYGLPVTIEDDCWIGGDVKIMPGITIGKGSTIGSGALVTKDIPPYSVAVGNPARVIKTVKSVEEERADPNFEFKDLKDLENLASIRT